MESLGQGSIARMRLSLGSTISQCGCSQPYAPASPPAPRLTYAPEPAGTPRFPHPVCSVWTPEPSCWPCPGPALAPTTLLPLISGCLPTATFTPDAGVVNPHPLPLSHAHQGSY